MDLGRKLREITVTPAVIPIPQRETQHEMEPESPLAAPATKESPAEPEKREV